MANERFLNTWLCILGILFVLDGAITHYILAAIPSARELSPVLALLFSVDLNFGSLVRLVAVGLVLWLLWKVNRKQQYRGWLVAIICALVDLELFVIGVNLIQLWTA